LSHSNFAYPHNFLQCRNSHYIPVPHPTLLERDGSPRQRAKDNPKAVFVCPECGLASAYSAQDMVEHLVVEKLSLFQANECHLVSLQVECYGENCEAQKIIHTIQGNDNGTWRPTTAPADWSFSDSALCAAGHRLRLDGSKPHWAIPAEMPF
jgi:hypothetical protein